MKTFAPFLDHRRAHLHILLQCITNIEDFKPFYLEVQKTPSK